MAEELVDECCSFETDVEELYIKGKHRGKNKRYAPLIAQADITDEELDSLTPEARIRCGFDPEGVPKA